MNYGSVYGDGFYIGGIAGVVTGGGISDCANFGNVTATKLQAGGIAGYAINSTIQNSYSAADTVVGKKKTLPARTPSSPTAVSPAPAAVLGAEQLL